MRSERLCSDIYQVSRADTQSLSCSLPSEVPPKTLLLGTECLQPHRRLGRTPPVFEMPRWVVREKPGDLHAQLLSDPRGYDISS